MKPNQMFEQLFPVRKDLHSIRTKGTLLEDIAEVVIDDHGVNEIVASNSDHTCGISCSSSLRTNKDKTIGVYSFYCSMGIPTVAIGVLDNKSWKDVRAELRNKNLLR